MTVEEMETLLLMVRLVRSGSNQCTEDPSFVNLIKTVHLSGINQHPHRAIVLEYYELTLKYTNVLAAHVDCLSIVLQTFCGSNGLRHADPTVRSQCCYHLRTLCKQVSTTLKNQIPFVQGLLQQLHPFLDVPLTTTTNNATIATTNNNSGSLAFADRLQLFDVSGLLLLR